MSDQTTTTPPPPEQVEQERVTRLGWLGELLPTLKVTLGAFLVAFVVGAVLIVVSDEDVLDTLPYFFTYPWDFFSRAGDAIWESYSALVRGSLGSWNAVSTTLERSAPLICAGLGVTMAFRAGLFNIGGQGQIVMGSLCAGYVGHHARLEIGRAHV